jgi:hypothetical protein
MYPSLWFQTLSRNGGSIIVLTFAHPIHNSSTSIAVCRSWRSDQGIWVRLKKVLTGKEHLLLQDARVIMLRLLEVNGKSIISALVGIDDIDR